MATVSNSLGDVKFSRDEIVLLERSIKDENFRKLLLDFAKEVNDPDKRKQYEEEVKQWEKEKGVDVVFLDPSPGFALAVTQDGGEGGKSEHHPVCVNICSSDVIQGASLARAQQGNTLGHTWSVPHAVTKPREELVNGNQQLLRELHRGCEGKSDSNVNNTRVIVCNVVFHPDALFLAYNNHDMKQCVIRTAMDSLNQELQLKVKDPREIQCLKYVGRPTSSVIKKVVDKELYEKSNNKLDVMDKGEDERTKANGSFNKAQKEIRNQSTSELTKKKKNGACEAVAPKYTIKHVNNVDLQDFAIIPGRETSWRAHALQVEVHLPGVERAAQVDADIGDQSIKIATTATTPKYGVEIPLPYPVDENSSTAKFDLATQKLTFSLTVMPSKNDMTAPVPSPSSSLDSGIECEPGYRTNSDGDNSSEVSVSSQEEVSKDDGGDVVEEDEDDDEGSVFESAPSSPIRGYLVPNYSLKESEKLFYLIINCQNVVADSIKIQQNDNKKVIGISLTTIGGGQTPLCHNLNLDCTPHEITVKEVSHKICDDHVAVTVTKVKPAYWERVMIGKANCLQSVPVPKVEEPIIAQETKDESAKHGLENVGESVSPRKPRVTRAVSMCEESSSTPALRLKGPTCSWPRGILKRRSRSLSESQLGSVLPLESLEMTCETHLESDLQEDRDGEESVEENILSSSFCEKKSVRFNDVVSRQLFRSNSSILGQKAKNQKKAMKKLKSRNRHASGSDRDSDNSHSDPGPYSDFTATTTTSEEDTDATAEADEVLNYPPGRTTGGPGNTELCDVDLDVENNNSKNIALSSIATTVTTTTATTSSEQDNDDDGEGFIVKTSKKKKKNKKKNKKFEPSNNFIFQLDIEP